MYTNPELYLNGTAPLNVTGAVNTCVYEIGGTVGNCTQVTGTDVDSYLWCVGIALVFYFLVLKLMTGVLGGTNSILVSRQIGLLRGRLRI